MVALMVADVKQDLESLVEQVVDNAEAALVRTKAGKQAVLISLAEFNSWQETAYLLSNPANAAHLEKSIAQAKAGKVTERELVE